MKKILFTLIATCLVGGAPAQDGDDVAAEAAKKAMESKDFAKLLKGQLIKVDGGKTKPAEFEAGKDYYVIYHSASW